MRKSKKDIMDFPCLECATASTKRCDISECSKVMRYNDYNEIPLESKSKGYSPFQDEKEIKERSQENGKDTYEMPVEGEHFSSLRPPSDRELNEPIDKKDLSPHIDRIFRGQKRLKRIFKQFLGCEKIVKLSQRLGVTHQNLQKVFHSRIKKLGCYLSKGTKKDADTATPLKFKTRVGVMSIDSETAI